MTWYASLRFADLAVGNEPTIRQILAHHSPRIAMATPAPQLCLLADMGRREVPYMMAWADTLLEAIWVQLAIIPALGLAESPLLATLASQVIPAGAAALVRSAHVMTFLAPHPLTLLPITPTLVERLRLFGLRNIGQVAALPRDALQAQFGVQGAQLWDLACGRGSLCLNPEPDQPHLIVRRMFREPIADQRMLLSMLSTLAQYMAQRLDADGWSAGSMVLSMFLEDGPPQTHMRLLDPAGSEAARIAALLAGMLMSAPPPCAVIGLRVSANDLTARQAGQLTLFPVSSHPNDALATLIDQLGPHVRRHIQRAAVVDPTARCLEQQAWIGEQRVDSR